MRKVVLPDRGAEILFSGQDQNIHFLESLFSIDISARGSQLFISGEEQAVQALERILRDFSDLVSHGQQFSDGELKGAFQQIAEDAALTLHDFFPTRPVLKTPVRKVVPRSPNQTRYVTEIQRNDLVFSIGPAGTGKTYLAVAMGMSCLMGNVVQRLILARPAVEAGERLGFLPGDMQEKINPYLRPLYDALFHMLDGEKVQKFMERGVIEIAPLAFMRGRTLSDSFIILDEAQNTTPEQMKMFLTRIGLNSKAVVTGDVTQVDLPQGQISGLIQARKLMTDIEGISFCEFDQRDVVRHRLVKLIIQAYEKA